MTHRVAVVGGRGAHARVYADLDRCDLVAVANPTRESAERFADEHAIPAVFADHVEMVRSAEPDVVSVVTPEPTHAPIVTDIAEAGIPGAIHCEKPMAHTFAGARQMVAACERANVQLTFHHQYRFKEAFRVVKTHIDRGEIGDLQRVSYGFPDLFTHGTHSIDLCGFYTDEASPEWVIGQIDYREENVHRGTHNENQAFGMWAYENGVLGLGSTQLGADLVDERGATARFDCPYSIHNRVDGTDGTILVVQRHVDEGPKYVTLSGRPGGEWEQIAQTSNVHPGRDDRLAIEDCLDAFEYDTESELSARNALKTTEILFSVWESSRRRGRVDLPLEIDDNPLEAMVASGDLDPSTGDH